MAEAKAKAKGPALPAVMTANNLLGGEVVFLGSAGWTPDPSRARIALDTATAALLEAEAARSFAANLVVDPYLVAVDVGPDGIPLARHHREAIRFNGPSVHPEFGKRAEFNLPS